MLNKVYWTGAVVKCDMCLRSFAGEDKMFDAATAYGWANLCERCFRDHGRGLGTGRGQRYERQNDGRWLKTAG